MKDTYCVIMSGGIGSRFWPFSRESRPKQFLDFFGNGQSFLQKTVERFARIIPFENIYIVTNQLYASLVKEQFPQLRDEQVLLEPVRRNTAPCIAYAAYHIRAVNPNANIVVAPSDHLIKKEDEFLEAIKKGFEFVKTHKALLTLGIKTTRPATEYGYLQSDEKIADGFFKVKTFVEKPDLELAAKFHANEEFFWNSGLFIWNVNTILDAVHTYLPDIADLFDTGLDKLNTPDEQAFIGSIFDRCTDISIDYGLMEKAKNVYMLSLDVGWADLGTWGSVFEEAARTPIDNNAILKGSKILTFNTSDCIIGIDKPERLTVIQGLTGYIVVESDNVLLICKKEEEAEIPQLIEAAKKGYGGVFI
ncbi:MAG: mannose-1-phosphate guanylyltransferase [Tannerella sp.]|nr:mannose-1-phosphate guanylyltransferase [Tannerella sp.]